MTKAINIYGDRLVRTTGLHGGNVSSQRRDELDDLSLDFLRQVSKGGNPPKALDLGCGDGAHSRRMADLGADVLAFDLIDQGVTEKSAEVTIGSLQFYEKDIRDLDFATLNRQFDIVYSQRMMGCLQYLELKTLLKELFTFTRTGGCCFLSVSGLESELASGYAGAGCPLEKRWAKLSSPIANRHQVHVEECLYTESEFVELLRSVGFTILRSWTSKFGTPKVVGCVGG